jgi:tight adherence protein C
MGSSARAERFMTLVAAAWMLVVVVGGLVYRNRAHRRTVGIAVLFSLLWPPLALAPIASAVLWKRWQPLAKARNDKAAVTASLPDATDLLLVAIHAGLTPELALRRLLPYLDGPLYEAVEMVFEGLTNGERFGDALDALINTLGEPARPLVAALTGSERYGLPLGPALEVVATISRDQRRRAAETSARKLPVRLSFPLVLCILPAFIVLTVVPAIFGALRALP